MSHPILYMQLYLLFQHFPPKFPANPPTTIKFFKKRSEDLKGLHLPNMFSCAPCHSFLTRHISTIPPRNLPAVGKLNVFVWQLRIWKYAAHRHAWLHSLSPRKRLGGLLGFDMYIIIYGIQENGYGCFQEQGYPKVDGL